MTIYEFTPTQIRTIPEASFAENDVGERRDLQRLLREKIQIVSPGTLVIAEEFGDFEDSRRRIDLLCVDRDANLVVIELKRTDDGGHMELQALRYAAMVSTMTLDNAIDVFSRYLQSVKDTRDARQTLLDFLEWEEPDESRFGNDVRIVLVSADFSKEITTTVLWLNERSLDVRCFRLKPYSLDGRLILDAQQVIPLPEATMYQIQVREKQLSRRSQKWAPKSEDAVWQIFEDQCSPDLVQLAHHLCEWISPLVTDVFPTVDGFAQLLDIGSMRYFFFKLRPDGKVAMWFQFLAKKPPFTDEAIRNEFLARINQLPGVNIDGDQFFGRPNFPMSVLLDPTSLKSFKATIEWAIEIARNYHVSRAEAL